MLRPACWINVDRHPAQCWPVSGFRHDGFAARVFGLNWRASAGNLPTCRNGSAAIWVLIWLPLNRSQPLFMGRASAVAKLYCLGWIKRRKNDDGASGRTVLVAVKSPLPAELKTFSNTGWRVSIALFGLIMVKLFWGSSRPPLLSWLAQVLGYADHLLWLGL